MPDIWVDLYCRVSTSMQAEEGYSLQEQESRLKLYAEAQGWRVYQTYLDGGFSGKSTDRPGLQALIRDCSEHRVQKVITYKLDRLSRSQKDTLHLIEDVFIANGVDYVSMTETLDTGTPLGKAMIGILAVFAQLEREEIAERMMMGRVASAKEGNWRGGSGVPIGYRYIPRTNTEDGHLDVNEYEANIVREVFRLFLSGKTFNAIHEEMKSAGYTTSYGGFGGGGASLIPAMLANRAYIGEIKYQGVWYKGKHSPIIDPDTFQRAQDRLADYRATLDANRRQPFTSKRQLTGLLYCANCGAKWAHHFSHYRNKAGQYTRYETYRCYSVAKNKRMQTGVECDLRPWRASELEELVWSQVLGLTFSDATRPESIDVSPVAGYEARIAEIDRQLSRLIQLFSLGSLPFEAIQKQSDALTQEKARLHDAIDAASRGSGRMSEQELRDALAVAPDIYASDDEKKKHDYLVMLIKRITVGADSVSIEWNI